MTHSRPRLGAVLLILVIVTGGLARSGGALTTQSEDAINVSGLVVDYGDGGRAYALVPFAEETISGMDLLRRSGLSLLSVEFGGMGEGVCAIEETGCDLSACRVRLCQNGDPDSPFWQYVRLDDDGQWQPAPLGASSSTVGDGEVNGWFWTDETPESGATTLAAIAAETGTDLETFASSSASDLEPVVVTVGGDQDDDTSSILAGIAVVTGMAALGGVLVLRSRRHRS